MNEEDITLEALSGESQLNSSDAQGAVDTVTGQDNSNGDSMTLAELNEFLGKNFKDKETALKALKDTFSYVGKKKDDIEKEVKSRISDESKTDQLARELAEMRKERFFDKNPQFSDPNVRKLIESLGGEPHEVVERPEFKQVFEKVKNYDESTQMKNVLDSNSRLAQSKTTLQKAQELKNSGASSDEVESLIVQAVLGKE